MLAIKYTGASVSCASLKVPAGNSTLRLRKFALKVTVEEPGDILSPAIKTISPFSRLSCISTAVDISIFSTGYVVTFVFADIF